MYKIIVVEDEILVKKGLILTTDWQKYNCEVVGEASNGIEGIDIISRIKPDIVLTDIRMPGMDGLTMIEKAKENGIRTEFIVITGFSEFEYAKKAVKLGVFDFLVKPIEDEDLDNAIRNACKAVSEKNRIDRIENKLDNIEDSKVMLFKEYIINEEKEDYVSRALKYISLNYNKDITVKIVADMLFISESYLSRLFKHQVGQTFGDYLQYYRIKKACELLKAPDGKIYEISNKIGYKDQRYFSLIFKKLVGITPKEFKNKLKDNNYNNNY